jgi:hypothetical protein
VNVSLGDHTDPGIAERVAPRGHGATILTKPLLQQLIEHQGLGLLRSGTLDDARAAISDPDLWGPAQGIRSRRAASDSAGDGNRVPLGLGSHRKVSVCRRRLAAFLR